MSREGDPSGGHGSPQGSLSPGLIDLLEKIDAMLGIAWEVLLAYDGEGGCCVPQKPGWHAKDCKIQDAIRRIERIRGGKMI